MTAVVDCLACQIEAEIGTEENPHPVPRAFHACHDPEVDENEGWTHFYNIGISINLPPKEAYQALHRMLEEPRDTLGRCVAWYWGSDEYGFSLHGKETAGSTEELMDQEQRQRVGTFRNT